MLCTLDAHLRTAGRNSFPVPDHDVTGAGGGDYEHDGKPVFDMRGDLAPGDVLWAEIERHDLNGEKHGHDHGKQDDKLDDFVFLHDLTCNDAFIEL